MQLKKQKIKHAPDFNAITAPKGVKRHPADFNQVGNKQQRNRNKHGDSFK